jgi:AbrB family looped-hinge helix DNA binding protein
MSQRKLSKAKKAKPAGFSEGEATFQGPGQGAVPASKVAHVEMGAGGRLVIPAPMRAALGMKPGDTLTVRLEENQISVYTYKEGIRRIQERMRPYLPENAVDEFLKWKRQEAAREEAEMDRWTRGE